MILGKYGKYISNFLLFFIVVNLYFIWTSNKDFDSHLKNESVNSETRDYAKPKNTAGWYFIS